MDAAACGVLEKTCDWAGECLGCRDGTGSAVKCDCDGPPTAGAESCRATDGGHCTAKCAKGYSAPSWMTAMQDDNVYICNPPLGWLLLPSPGARCVLKPGSDSEYNATCREQMMEADCAILGLECEWKSPSGGLVCQSDRNPGAPDPADPGKPDPDDRALKIELLAACGTLTLVLALIISCGWWVRKNRDRRGVENQHAIRRSLLGDMEAPDTILTSKNIASRWATTRVNAQARYERYFSVIDLSSTFLTESLDVPTTQRGFRWVYHEQERDVRERLERGGLRDDDDAY